MTVRQRLSLAVFAVLALWGVSKALRRFELHHLHYQSIGREQIHDVRLLCPKCHGELHEGA